ncbi:phage replisome organizer N-terminal domain-containing protein [Streptococcus suis]|uniref:phage replisome organizer N-terminal domain-containing protein n=3 Tax=Streptococcus suis TaxID=1307 RepID=UPI000CF44683|nr:phage replisome organizer N-terminal domain-containing protein [Streptococcus suis]HEL2203754.1 phage replisome organizer N-terminal domain-containing protein [Streptococcus suis]HEM4972394.1 phage replisome organizer N-terminal domain-containing protein [Streptococcus suis]HEM5158601.1 phage replisome organizer N-terminal domain-containing protein [Streptococcus suis]HEM5323015.1 phage replisome organizer N-terminal domain-containing protein [Streptococcus suis]HEM5336435.1 phage replisome
MADNKKYYYLKLKDNFFESDEAIILESMPDGYIYSNILLKLYLRSLKNNGLLMFNDLIPYNAQMLATITRHHVGVIEKAIQIFQQLRLIEILDNGAIYMTNIQNFVGKSSTDADRKRAEYNKIKRVGEISTIETDKTPPEIEIEEDINKDIKLNINKDIYSELDNSAEQSSEYTFPSWLNQSSIEELRKTNPKNYPIYIPIQYLNQETGHTYKFIATHTKFIQARYKDGYTLEDFKKVIDTKVAQWKNNIEMAKYLRPKTLFSPSNFDSYLNEMPKRVQTEQDNIEPLPF